MALYSCTWRWPGVEDPKERWQRFARTLVALDEATPMRQHLKGWYTYPGEWAGFLLVEAAGHEELRELLQPLTGLMQFDVKAVVPVDYDEALRHLAAIAQT